MNLKKKLIIGTANFGSHYGLLKKKNSDQDFKKIIADCKRYSIDRFDLAESYQLPKNYIEKIKKQKIHLKFEFSKYRLKNIESIIIQKKIQAFLKKNNLKKIDTILLHNQSDLISSNSKNIYNALAQLKKKKIILNIGVSFYDTDVLLKVLNKYKIDSIHVPINLLNHDFIKPSLIRLYKKLNLKVCARSIFLQGLLLNFFNNKIYSKKFNQFKTIFNNLRKYQINNNLTPLEHSLSFIYSLKFLNGIIIGIDNEHQLHKIINTKIKKINITRYRVPKIFTDPRKW